MTRFKAAAVVLLVLSALHPDPEGDSRMCKPDLQADCRPLVQSSALRHLAPCPVNDKRRYRLVRIVRDTWWPTRAYVLKECRRQPGLVAWATKPRLISDIIGSFQTPFATSVWIGDDTGLGTVRSTLWHFVTDRCGHPLLRRSAAGEHL